MHRVDAWGSNTEPNSLQTATDYGSYLANEASPLYVSTIVAKCTQKLVDDWIKMRANVSKLQLSS